MKILVIGSGGREHALAWKCAQDSIVEHVYVCPGNAGTHLENKVSNVEFDLNEFSSIEKFCLIEKIGLVIIGPEQPLVDGLSDYLQSKNIKTFGPSKNAAQLEGSKTFSKDFFVKYGIPTAKYKSFDNFKDSIQYLHEIAFPTVIKADGLAAGKGVIICQNFEEAEQALNSIFNDKAFGTAGNRVVVEEFLEGEEASFIAVVSKDKIIPLATSQDHKAVGDGDKGLNTGGMGAYSPAPIVTKEIHEKILNEVMYPTMNGLIEEGSPYLGFLYAGLMIKDGEIKVLEFNCRFGDPETQVVLPRLTTDLVSIVQKTIKKNLKEMSIDFIPQNAITVVIASKGYPGEFEKEVLLPSLKNFDNEIDIYVFHSGTSKDKNDNLVSSGGRVLSITSIGENIKDCRQKAYNIVEALGWDKGFYRRDIGKL